MNTRGSPFYRYANGPVPVQTSPAPEGNSAGNGEESVPYRPGRGMPRKAFIPDARRTAQRDARWIAVARQRARIPAAGEKRSVIPLCCNLRWNRRRTTVLLRNAPTVSAHRTIRYSIFGGALIARCYWLPWGRNVSRSPAFQQGIQHIMP